jgi:hypothetical protein
MPAVGEALARLLDNPKAVNRHPAAVKVLGALLEKLRSASRVVGAEAWQWYEHCRAEMTPRELEKLPGNPPPDRE